MEVECKFRVAHDAALAERMRREGLEPREVREEVDEYYNAPDRDFGRTDEALRLRQTGAGNVLTYKGPKQGAVGKTRFELEVPLADGAEAAELLRQALRALRYRPTLTVRKHRQYWRPGPGAALPRDLVVTLDDVAGLGQYVELERQTEAAQADAVQAELQALAQRLGLGPDERRSYLEMLLAHPGGDPAP